VVTTFFFFFFRSLRPLQVRQGRGVFVAAAATAFLLVFLVDRRPGRVAGRRGSGAG
jgi:hypothetical protein